MIVCLFLWKKVIRKEIFLSLCGVVAVTAVINLWWIVPFLDYTSENLHIYSEEMPNIQIKGIFLGQLFLPFSEGNGYSWAAAFGTANEMPLCLGLSFVFCLFFLLYQWICGVTKEEETENYEGKWIGFLGLGALFMTTVYFPYDTLMKQNRVFYRMVGAIQFPWRFLIVAILCLTFSMCIFLGGMKKNGQGKQGIALTKILGWSIVISYAYLVVTFFGTQSAGRIYDTGGLNSMDISGAEYLPAETDRDALIEDRFVTGEKVSVKGYVKKALNVRMKIENAGDMESYVELPLLYYKGYRAKCPETGEMLRLEAGENNVVRVFLPAGFLGNVEVDFYGFWYWRMAEIISFIAIVAISAAGWYVHRRKG